MKKIFSVLILVLLLFSTDSLEIHAKSYAIEEAYFDVEILSDGDVEVTETWIVNFDGDYSRFYKSLPPKKISKSEKYSDICINWATVNGIDCELDGDLDRRKDYTFNSDYNDDYRMLSWLYHVNSERVEYSVNYTIEDLTKRTDLYNKELCVTILRPVCVDFKQGIQKGIHISVKLPNNSEVYDFKSNKNFDMATDENTMQLKCGSSSGLVRLVIFSTDDGFEDDLTFVKSKDIDMESSDNGNSNHKSLVGIVLIVVLVLYVVGLYKGTKNNNSNNRNNSKNKRYKRMNENDPSYIYECINDISMYKDDALLPVALCDGRTNTKFNLLSVMVKDFLNRKLFVNGIQGIDVNYDLVNAMPSMEQNVLIRLAEEINKFNNGEIDIYVMRSITDSYVSTLAYDLKSKVDSKEYKKLKKEAAFIEWYANYAYKTNIPASMNYFIHHDVNRDTLILLSFKNNRQVNVGNISTNGYATNTWYYTIDNHEDHACATYLEQQRNANKRSYSSSYDSSSSSGCSSCSSCSSCGGCGGAD